MKRRNVDSAKMRRTLKKNRASESFCSGSLVYLKILFVWAFVIMVDFLLDFRFEYFWPTWLLLRSICDSFRYQGLAFSVFFVCITLTLDLICFVFVPLQYLFFFASTYVWVQYVWHADRGVCLPTVTLWLLFVYVEASVRLKEIKSLPFTLDLCRPFAAHCIGYPIVTLGFGVKTYVGYRLRLRKRREVARENETYVQLLNESLPALDDHQLDKRKSSTVVLSSEELISNGAAVYASNGHCHNNSSSNINRNVRYRNNSSSPAILYSSSYGNRGNRAGDSSSADCDNSLANVNLIRDDNNARFTKNFLRFTSPKMNCNDDIAAVYGNSWTGDDDVDESERFKLNNNNNNSSTFYIDNDRDDVETLDESHSGGRDNNNQELTLDDDDDDYVGDTKNSSTLVAWLSYLITKLIGVKDSNENSHRDTDEDCTATYDLAEPSTKSSSNKTANGWLRSAGSTTTDECFGGGRDSDSESRTSKDSCPNKYCTADGSNPGGGGVDVGFSRQKSAPAQCRGKTKRRGGSSDVCASARPKDINSIAQSLGQKEKVQDKDLYLSLESDIEKLKAELTSGRIREKDLRRQINDLVTSDKSVKNELQQQRQLNEQLQTKLQNLVRARQQDKQTVATLEKRVCEEQKLKGQLEQMLQQEKKQQLQQKKAEETAKTAAASASSLAKTDCTEACKSRRRELDTQIKQTRRDLQQRDERLSQLELELRSLRSFKESNNADLLMSALSAMQEKNQHLETSLSAETRIKLDLFSALGDARRQLEIARAQSLNKDRELDELRKRLSQQLPFFGLTWPLLTPPPSAPPSASATLDSAMLDISSSAYSSPNFIQSMVFDDSGSISPSDFAGAMFPLLNNNNNNVSGESVDSLSARSANNSR